MKTAINSYTFLGLISSILDIEALTPFSCPKIENYMK